MCMPAIPRHKCMDHVEDVGLYFESSRTFNAVTTCGLGLCYHNIFKLCRSSRGCEKQLDEL